MKVKNEEGNWRLECDVRIDFQKTPFILKMSSGDDERFAKGEDVIKRVHFQQSVCVVLGHAHFAACAKGEIPKITGSWGGHAAKEAGELARASQGAVFFFDEGLDEGEVIAGSF